MSSSTPAAISAAAIRRIISASSAGTVIEFYDFYLFGSLATILAGQFFPGSNPTAATLYTLAIFAAGFLTRPFGAWVFGRLGDRIGRKYTFLLTLIIMGGSTFAIGLVPGYASIGFAAPLILLLLRLLQGLALGGEYSGAAIYVAEHVPANRRGYFTSWIQAAATVGLLLGLGVILVTRYALDADHDASLEKFNAWGWRIPFLLAIFGMAISVYIRLKMQDSPLFPPSKTKGTPSVNPLRESPARKTNRKLLLVFFGATIGQGVIFYTGLFYSQSFLENVCQIDFGQSKTMMLIAIALALPFFILFGRWSDRGRRERFILAGMLLAILTYPFLFRQLLNTSAATGRTELTGQKEIRSSVAFIDKTRNMVQASTTLTTYEDGMVVTETQKDTVYADGRTGGIPAKTVSKTLNTADYWKITIILFVMVFYVTMLYGPIAAFLVELFPTGIRYMSSSLPEHIGNGIFGGMTPFIATLLTTLYPGNKLAGLWYPIVVAGACFLIGAFYIPRGKNAGHLNFTP